MGPTASPPTAFASGEACFTPEDIDFSWQPADVPAPLTVTYTLQISNSAAFPAGPETLEVSGLSATFHTVDGADLRSFTTNFQHYWRVIATSNTGAATIAGPIMFTTQNRADFNADGEVDGADLATLLSD